MTSGLLKPVFNAPGKRGRQHTDDLRTVVDAMLHIAQTGCQWRYLPESFGPWTRVWSQMRTLPDGWNSPVALPARNMAYPRLVPAAPPTT